MTAGINKCEKLIFQAFRTLFYRRKLFTVFPAVLYPVFICSNTKKIRNLSKFLLQTITLCSLDIFKKIKICIMFIFHSIGTRNSYHSSCEFIIFTIFIRKFCCIKYSANIQPLPIPLIDLEMVAFKFHALQTDPVLKAVPFLCKGFHIKREGGRLIRLEKVTKQLVPLTLESSISLYYFLYLGFQGLQIAIQATFLLGKFGNLGFPCFQLQYLIFS